MDILCCFYIGHQDYLGEAPHLTEAESRAALASEVTEALEKNLGPKQSDIQPAINPGDLSASLTFSEQSFAARGFSTETAVAEDQQGLPVLLYVNAYFPVPPGREEVIAELEESGELDGLIQATLTVSGRPISFEGISEVVFE